MPEACVMIPSEVTARPAWRERRVKHPGKNNHLVKNAIRCRSLYRHEIKVKLCQKPLSKQDQCVCVLPYNRVIFLPTALGSCETYSSLKPSCGNQFTFCLINTHIDTYTIARKHSDPRARAHTKTKNPHIWCLGGGTFVRSWSDSNCTQIKMDLALAVGSVIHSDAAAQKDLSGVKSDASLSHPNTYHIRKGSKRNSCIELHHAQCRIRFISLSSKYLITSGRFEDIRI